jgi:hypothetical protein
MMHFCLIDACESQHPITNASEICLFGRLESGESASIIVTNPVFTIYMAAHPTWDQSSLQHDLSEHIKNWNGLQTEADLDRQQRQGEPPKWKRTRCTRTLCSCKACKKCQSRKCVCRCYTCKEDPCVCKQFSISEINHDVCASKRRKDVTTVLRVESVMAHGYTGYEPEPRRFIRVYLARACYASPAKDYLQGVNTGLPDTLAGVYGYVNSAVCAFMQDKRAAGMTWLELTDPSPVHQRRSRCTHEFQVCGWSPNDRVPAKQRLEAIVCLVDQRDPGRVASPSAYACAGCYKATRQ